MSDTQEKILSLMRDNPNVRKPELAKKIGVSHTTIDKGISYLKKNGMVERVGSNKNGHWNVLK